MGEWVLQCSACHGCWSIEMANGDTTWGQAAESRVVHAKESAEEAKLPTPEARIFP